MHGSRSTGDVPTRQLNTYDYEAMSRFYAGFGFAPDPLSEGRPNVDYRKLIDMTGLIRMWRPSAGR